MLGVRVDCSVACAGTRRGTTPPSADAGESTEVGDAVTAPSVPEGGMVSRVPTDRSRERGRGVATRLGGGNRAGIVEMAPV